MKSRFNPYCTCNPSNCPCSLCATPCNTPDVLMVKITGVGVWPYPELPCSNEPYDPIVPPYVTYYDPYMVEAINGSEKCVPCNTSIPCQYGPAQDKVATKFNLVQELISWTINLVRIDGDYILKVNGVFISNYNLFLGGSPSHTPQQTIYWELNLGDEKPTCQDWDELELAYVSGDTGAYYNWTDSVLTVSATSVKLTDISFGHAPDPPCTADVEPEFAFNDDLGCFYTEHIPGIFNTGRTQITDWIVDFGMGGWTNQDEQCCTGMGCDLLQGQFVASKVAGGFWEYAAIIGTYDCPEAAETFDLALRIFVYSHYPCRFYCDVRVIPISFGFGVGGDSQARYCAHPTFENARRAEPVEMTKLRDGHFSGFGFWCLSGVGPPACMDELPETITITPVEG